MATLGELQFQLDKLRKLRNSGVRRIRYEQGNEVEYQPGDDIVSAIKDLEDEISRLQGSKPRRGVAVMRGGS